MTRMTLKHLARALAACAFAVLATHPATAQQSTTVLRNLGESLDACSSHPGATDLASRFQTGANALSVDAVEISWDHAGDPGYNRVGIFSHDAGTGRPGSRVGSTWLEHISPTTDGGIMTYTASGATIALQPNTDYWVVLQIADGAVPSCTVSSSFFAEPAAGNPSLLRQMAAGSLNNGVWQDVADGQALAYGLSAIIGAIGPGPGPGPGPGNPGNVQAVPTLTEWGVLTVSAILIGGALLTMRRQRRG